MVHLSLEGKPLRVTAGRPSPDVTSRARQFAAGSKISQSRAPFTTAVHRGTTWWASPELPEALFVTSAISSAGANRGGLGPLSMTPTMRGRAYQK